MGEQSNFALRLIDRVTGPARKAMAALRGVTRAARQARAATEAATASAIRVPGARAAGIRATRVPGHPLGAMSHRQARMAPRGVVPTAGQGPGKFMPKRGGDGKFLKGQREFVPEVPEPKGVRKWTKSLFEMNSAAGKSFGKLKKMWGTFRGTPIGMILSTAVSGMWKFARAIVGATIRAAKLGTTIGVLVSAALAKFTLDMGVVAIRSKTAWGIMEKSMQRGEAAWFKTRELARDFGLSLRDTNESMIGLRKQGFGFDEAGEIVKMTADMQAVGATADQVKHAVLAITQVKSKGFLFAEELRQQLAETGVPVQGVIEQVAILEGISLKAARAMVQNGKVTADVGIEAVKAAVRVQLGIEKAGDAALKFSKTLPGLLQQLRNIDEQFFADISGMVNMEIVKGAVEDIIRAIESIDRRKVAVFVENVFKAVRGLIKLAKEFADGFGSEFDAGLKAIDFDKPSKETLAMARTVGRLAAVFMESLPRAIGVAFRAVQGFFRGLGFESVGQDLVDGINAIDWDALGAKVEAAGEKIGKVVKSMWDELAGKEDMVNSIGVRLGRALIAGVAKSVEEFSMVDYVLGKFVVDDEEAKEIGKELGFETPAKSLDIPEEFNGGGYPRNVIPMVRPDGQGRNGAQGRAAPTATPTVTNTKAKSNIEKIELNFNGVNPNDPEAVRRLVKKAVEEALAQQADDVEEAVEAS